MKGFWDMCMVGPSVDLELVKPWSKVSNFASSFTMVGFEEGEMEYQGEYNVDLVT